MLLWVLYKLITIQWRRTPTIYLLMIPLSDKECDPYFQRRAWSPYLQRIVWSIHLTKRVIVISIMKSMTLSTMKVIPTLVNVTTLVLLDILSGFCQISPSCRSCRIHTSDDNTNPLVVFTTSRSISPSLLIKSLPTSIEPSQAQIGHSNMKFGYLHVTSPSTCDVTIMHDVSLHICNRHRQVCSDGLATVVF